MTSENYKSNQQQPHPQNIEKYPQQPLYHNQNIDNSQFGTRSGIPIPNPQYPGASQIPQQKTQVSMNNVKSSVIEKDERISQVNPESNNWLSKKALNVQNETAVLNKYAEGLREHENYKNMIEDMERRKTGLEDWIKKQELKSYELDNLDLVKKNEYDNVMNKEKQILSSKKMSETFMNAYQGLASEIQSKIASMQVTCDDKTNVLKELNKKEWIRVYDNEKQKVVQLRNQILGKSEEISKIKNQIKHIPESLRGEVSQEHMASIIEQQYEELVMAKKQTIEHESRAKHIQSDWNNFIQENMSKDETIKGLKLQIERNLDNLQQLLVDHDNQMYEQCKKVYEMIDRYGEEEQKEASYFLIDQLPLLQEERREIVMENEQFHLSNQDLINHIETTKTSIERQRALFDENLDLDQATYPLILDSLKNKLDSIHERIEQEKNMDKVSKITQLRAALEPLEKGIMDDDHRKQELYEELNSLLKNQAFSDEKSIIDFFSRMVEERDQKVARMVKQLELFKVVFCE